MKNFGEFFNNQIEFAKTIILSRTQNVSQKKLDEAVVMIREKNQEARILTTPWDELPASKIVEAMEASTMTLKDELFHDETEHDHHHHDHEECECGHDHHHHDHEECECGHDHHHHHADDVFGTWGTETSHAFTKEQLNDILNQLTDEARFGQVLRAKGIVKGEEAWYYFDMVPGEVEIRTGNADYTGRFCVIGAKLNEEALKQLFLGV